jgi:hypothetical protein
MVIGSIDCHQEFLIIDQQFVTLELFTCNLEVFRSINSIQKGCGFQKLECLNLNLLKIVDTIPRFEYRKGHEPKYKQKGGFLIASHQRAIIIISSSTGSESTIKAH